MIIKLTLELCEVKELKLCTLLKKYLVTLPVTSFPS